MFFFNLEKIPPLNLIPHKKHLINIFILFIFLNIFLFFFVVIPQILGGEKAADSASDAVNNPVININYKSYCPKNDSFVVLFCFLKFLVLESLQSSAAHAVTDSVWAELSAIAADAVNVIVGTVVQVGRVQRVMAIAAVKTALVPNLICPN